VISMPSYQIDIVARGVKQTFITENMDDDKVIKNRIKGFVDMTNSLTNFTLSVKPYTQPGEKYEHVPPD